MYKKILSFFFFFTVLLINSSAQDLIQDNGFTHAPMFNNKVVFLKTIALTNPDKQIAYQRLKDWGKQNYGTDFLISSIRYDHHNYEIIVKSRIELILPPDSKKNQEKAIMTYRLNAFILDGKCVFEVKDIVYQYDKTKTDKVYPKSPKAEEIIADYLVGKQDELSELRANTRKSTFYFLNELTKQLEKAVNTTVQK